jgi:galactokinase
LAKYNAVSERARKACALYNAHYGTQHETLGDIVRENAGMDRQGLLDKFEEIPDSTKLPDVVLDRFRQFVTESEYFIPRGTDALAKGAWEEFGHGVDMSHINSRKMLWNIIPEVDHLQQTARKLGAIAASGFGAGFGGSAYAIVRSEQAETFQKAWEKAYWAKFPQHRGKAVWLTTRPSGAAHPIKD